MPPILDLDALDRAVVQRDPCNCIMVPRFVAPEALAELNRDYPEIEEPGNFPPAQLSFGPTFGRLIEELNAPELRRLVARKFEIDLESLPLQMTVRKFSEASDGAIHNDSRTKIVTALIYFNESWPHREGALRLLRSSSDINDYAVEVPPMDGNLIIFQRSEKSYHGFEPFSGERRSLQMYWVKPKREGRDDARAGGAWRRFKRIFKRG